jgi:hypothetical protein
MSESRCPRLAPAATLLALVLSGLAASPTARGQQPERVEGSTVVSDSQFAQLPATTADGEKYTIVYAKWFKVFNDQLKLQSSQLNDRVIVKDEALRTNLQQNLDSDGNRLVPKRTNLQLTGTGVRTPKGYALLVTRVHALETDIECGVRRAAALAADDAPRRVELARYLQARLLRYFQGAADQDPNERRDLLRLMRRLEEEARSIELNRLPALPAGAEERIGFGQRNKAIGVLAQVWAHPEVPAELRAQALRVLRNELQAQLYLGQWYSYEDMKDLLDFERTADGQWLPRSRVAFRRACDDVLKRLSAGEPLLALSENLLEEAKDVVRGMNKDRVLLLKGGYPVRVDRLREQRGGTSIVLEEWAFEDGMLVRFVNGIVFEKVGGGGE